MNLQSQGLGHQHEQKCTSRLLHTLKQWFSNFGSHQNPLAGLLEKVWGGTPAANAAGPGTTFYSRLPSRLYNKTENQLKRLLLRQSLLLAHFK